MMKKLLCTLVAASAVGLMGCPPPSGGGNNPPATDKAPDTSTPSTDAGTGAAPATEAGKTDAPPPATEAAKPAAADLSHVKAGQKYHYEMQNNMQQIWTVDEVTADTVKYKTQMIMNGNPLGDPQAAEWKWTAPAAATTTATTDQPAAKISREKVTISGTEFDCMVSEANGAKAWVPTKGGEYNVTFPGIVKSQMADGSVVMELKKIE
jgi:hypothetical protein